MRLAWIALAGCAAPPRAPAIAEPPAACELPALTPGREPRFEAFRARLLAAAPDARAAIVEQFASGGVPSIGEDGTVVFVHAGAATEVRVVGDFRAKSFFKIDWDPLGEPMTQLVDGVWFATLRFPRDARFDYQIVVDGKAGPDPLNPRSIESGIAGPSSELVMPDARAVAPRADVPHGTLEPITEAWATPKVTVYLPPGYDASRRYPTLYTADGSAWRDLVQLPGILDELIAARTIEPVIAVMIDAAADRTAWYMWNPAYLAYLDRVVAHVDRTYATRPEPQARIHAGTSAGGRASLQVGLARPGVFANIAMLSPSLVGPAHILEPYFRGAKPPPPSLRVWLSAGAYEGAICEDTRTMLRWFRASGIPAAAAFTREGHSFGTWRRAAREMLVHFL
jgi:enterochelin esterase-like enzyme